MNDFYPYWKKKRAANNLMLQNNIAPPIAKDKTIRARIWGDLLKEFEDDKKDSGIQNESEYIRMILKKYLNEQKIKQQVFELEGIE
jgi:hypothetical protein